jgi:rubrerythrin
MKTYTTKSGKTQYKPSLAEIEEASDDNGGFCLACGATVYGIEPDARQRDCPECGAHNKVYGAEELALMGLCYAD